jgi:hypothetical protein
MIKVARLLFQWASSAWLKNVCDARHTYECRKTQPSVLQMIDSWRRKETHNETLSRKRSRF